jgi:hypothetical protein
VKVGKRFFGDGVNTSSTSLPVVQRIKSASLILSDAAEACLPLRRIAASRTQVANGPTSGQFPIQQSLVEMHRSSDSVTITAVVAKYRLFASFRCYLLVITFW